MMCQESVRREQKFLGRLLDTVSSVSTLFTNPYRVRDVPLSDYGGGGKVLLKTEGRIVLYKNTQCQSWDCGVSSANRGLPSQPPRLELRPHRRGEGSERVPQTQLRPERGDTACVTELLEESQARTDIKDQDGETPMHCAAKQDTPAIIKTPLHVSCRLGRVESVKALLGAEPSVMSSRGGEILKADAGQLQAEDSLYGGTPLHWSKTAEMCRLLLEHGCAVNYLSKTGESALHILTRRGRFGAAMVLLTHGANANLKGQHGNTALHLAMKMDHMELIKALIVFGADVEIHNDLGETRDSSLLAPAKVRGEGRDIRCRGAALPPSLPRQPAPPPRQDQTPGIGLVLIQMLIALEREAGPTRELFDWVAGTSTGGILALAIVHGWEDEDVLVVGYTEEPARKRRKVTDEEQLVWRAARSSGAAPTYFRPMGRFLDGGLLANNPTLDAMTEIHQYNKALKAEGRAQEIQKLGVECDDEVSDSVLVDMLWDTQMYLYEQRDTLQTLARQLKGHKK
ncbi:hypothetical protein F7725_006273 [Dissostichus mawsoni]|uniref:Phospholipase A2 group VI n=1 Tax=Dissostichus mawsoni TaxID=36200 RepID=A0A7J5YXR4_DISMA|nr:hypothetical protein F7725_006273 [Dissostichus mawsoni]